MSISTNTQKQRIIDAFAHYVNAHKELSEAWQNYNTDNGGETLLKDYPFTVRLNDLLPEIEKWEQSSLVELGEVEGPVLHDNVLKVVDIDYRKISENTMNFLKESQVAYKDLYLKEDIYNIEDIIGEPESEIAPEVLTELTSIQETIAKLDVGYFRIIYP